MRPFYILAVAMLLGISLLFPACNAGPAGPAGPSGIPTPYCSSPSSQGTTVAGGSSGDGGGVIYASPVTLSTASTAVSISINVASGPATGQLRMAIYTDNAGTPTNLVAQTNPQYVVVGWNTVSIPPTYLSAGTYWMSVLFSNTNPGTFHNAIGSEKTSSYGWGVYPAVFPSFGSNTNQDDLYINTCP